SSAWIRALTMRWAWRNASRLLSSSPSTAAGSGSPQCARRKSPNTTGQVSAAAESQTVTTRSIGAASVVANSSQDLLRSLAVGMPSSASCANANGLTAPAGRLPALKASKRRPAQARRVASARMLRAELPVHRNNTRMGCLSMLASAAAGLRGAAAGALLGHRLHVGRVRRAVGVIGRAGGTPGVVRGRAPEGVERFPARALRVFRPVLVGLGIAADRRLLGDDGAAGGVQALAQRGEFVAAIDLEAQVVDTRRPAGI